MIIPTIPLVRAVWLYSKMASLFGHAGRSASKNLLEFRAGKMNLSGTTVTPDKRKGLVYIYQSEDSLMHFCWKDRSTSKLEDVSEPRHDDAKKKIHL
jgi:hypothetical protein